MQRAIIAFLFLAAAILCYINGFASGAIALILVGAVCELGFWFHAWRALKRK